MVAVILLFQDILRHFHVVYNLGPLLSTVTAFFRPPFLNPVIELSSAPLPEDEAGGGGAAAGGGGGAPGGGGAMGAGGPGAGGGGGMLPAGGGGGAAGTPKNRKKTFCIYSFTHHPSNIV